MISFWITALAIGGYAAAAAGLAHDIQGFVSGKTPWNDTSEWVTGALKAGGLGFAGGVIGGAVGPALGAAADALSVGAGTGTTAAVAGAPTGAASLSGVVPAEGASVLGAVGDTAPQSAISTALGNVASSAGKQAIGGAISGTFNNPSNPGQGALMGAATGAASGLASGIASQGINAAFKGQESGFWSPGPTRDFTIRYQPSDAPQYSIARDAMLNQPPSSTGSATMMGGGIQGPGFGGKLLNQVPGAAGNLAGQGAGMAINSAMTPGVPPPPNPYAYPNQPAPYYARAPYWTR